GPGIPILVDGPIRRVMHFPCLTAGDVRFLVPPLPARALGLPCGWLTVMEWQNLSGKLGSRICEMRAGWGPSLLRGGPVSSRTEASPVCLREGVLVSSLFSRHHRLS